MAFGTGLLRPCEETTSVKAHDSTPATNAAAISGEPAQNRSDTTAFVGKADIAAV
jgi:hypothetical protein